MSKSFLQNAEERSIFLVPSETGDDEKKKGERTDTRPLRTARLIEINRIKPDPEQPRKTLKQKTLESLAESIKELDGLIDPLTVQYDESVDVFRIISGERRYWAAKLVGLDRLPCIIKEVNDRERYLMQIVANLQREAISPLEEAAGIRNLAEKYGYNCTQIAKLLNKSKSYVSQTLGLERLSEPAKKIVQTSELSKEVQIQASREQNPQKQLQLLTMAADEGKTVRQIRKETKSSELSEKKEILIESEPDQKSELPTGKDKKCLKWTYESKTSGCILSIRFLPATSEDHKFNLVRELMDEALAYLNNKNKE